MVKNSNKMGENNKYMYSKNSNKHPGIYFNSWPSGENWLAIIRGYIPGS